MGKHFIAIVTVTVLSLSAVLLTTQLSKSDEWPLKDGRYVSDSKFCSYDDEQISDELGVEAGFYIRTFENGTINLHYETICRIERVKIDGSDLVFSRMCSAEGEEFEERTNFVVNSATSFIDDRTTFNLCAGQSNAVFDGDAIYSFQVSLNFLGFNAGAPDGKFGPRTRQAMNALQRDKGLPVTAQPNAETLKAALDAERAIYEGAKPIEPEKVEPSAGDESALDNIGEDAGTSAALYLEEQKTELVRTANLLRTELIYSPNLFNKYLSDEVLEDLRPILKMQEARNRLLTSSITLFGCVGDPVEVYGYYNAALNIWTFLWVKNRTQVEKAQISLGLAINDAPLLNSWFERMQRDEITGIDAIRQSILEQTYAFTLMFNPDTCSSIEDMEQGYFSPNEAVALVFRNENKIQNLNGNLANEIARNTEEKYVGIEDHSVILTRIEEDVHSENHYVLSLHSVREDPSVVILQKWEVSKGALILLEGALDFSLKEQKQ